MYYTHQELQFDHLFIVPGQLFQFLEGEVLVIWQGGTFFGTIIRHTRVEAVGTSMSFAPILYIVASSEDSLGMW